MDLAQEIKSYGPQPLPHHLLLALLQDYKRPHDKIHEWLKTGVLTSLKKGLYMAGPALKAPQPEPFLIANHLLGPSYVSQESALGWYGFIPERVFAVSSMTTRSSRSFETTTGVFDYTHLRLPYYALGTRRIELATSQFAIIASPEKAICDKIITTAGVLLRSRSSVLEYLVDNLRIDREQLHSLNTGLMESWLEEAPKKNSLIQLIKALRKL